MTFTVEGNGKNYLSDYLLFCVSFCLILIQIRQRKHSKKKTFLVYLFTSTTSICTLAWYKKWRPRAKFSFAVRHWPYESLMVYMTIGVPTFFAPERGWGGVNHLPKNSYKSPKFLPNSRKETRVIWCTNNGLHTVVRSENILTCECIIWAQKTL